MQITCLIFIIIAGSLVMNLILASSAMEVNLTDFMAHRRMRSLTYEDGGSIKFSVSGIWPLYLEDLVNWRQMNCIGGIQVQYNLPVKPFDLFDNWQMRSGKGLQTVSEKSYESPNIRADPSRLFTYAALEEFMNRNGRNGQQCLLRSICENAQVDDHSDVYSRMLDIVLSPAKDNLDEVYRDAMKAGKYGVDCLSAYPKCPYGDSFVDRITNVT